MYIFFSSNFPYVQTATSIYPYFCVRFRSSTSVVPGAITKPPSAIAVKQVFRFKIHCGNKHLGNNGLLSFFFFFSNNSYKRFSLYETMVYCILITHLVYSVLLLSSLSNANHRYRIRCSRWQIVALDPKIVFNLVYSLLRISLHRENPINVSLI